MKLTNKRINFWRGENLLSILSIFALVNVFGFAVGAQVAGLRTITISTEPQAIVWIDDVRYGKTGDDGKLVIKTISAGQHKIRVRADGFKETTQNLTPVQKGDVKIALAKTIDEAELAFQEAERNLSLDREKAAELYRKAIKARSKYPEAYLALARVLSDSQNLEEALVAVKQARKQRLNYAEAAAVEGRIYKELGDNEKAIASFKRAISEGKGFQPEALTGLGLLYKDQAEASAGDLTEQESYYTEAVNYLQKGIKQLSGAPDAEVLYQLTGLIYEKMKKYDDAIKLYEEFLRIFPDSNETSAVRSFIVQIKKQQGKQ